MFYLQSKLNSLTLDVEEAMKLRKKLKEASEGGEALELPRTHVLNLELARLKVALLRFQVRYQKTAFDNNVTTIQRLRRRLLDIQGKLIFYTENLRRKSLKTSRSN